MKATTMFSPTPTVRLPLISSILMCALVSACGGDSAPFEPEAYGEWIKFEPEGAVCANGSQYKYFINFSETSQNVVVFMEGGGACSSYETCGGGRSFNTDCIMEEPGATCIRDDYPAVHTIVPELAPFSVITEPLGVIDGKVPVELTYPMMSPNTDINPMGDWTKVFVPYCTGDTYLGSRVHTYVDPDGVGPDVEFHHMGHQNMLIVTEQLNAFFDEVPKLMVSGCSAGGLGSLNNYPFIREGMDGVEQGYLLADSGPVMPSGSTRDASNQLGLTAVQPLWGVETLIDSLAIGSDRVKAEYGEINAVISEIFPDDRLSISMFERDYVYSPDVYTGSFEFFANPDTSRNTGPGRTEVYRLATEDLAELRLSFDEIPNLAYYMPNFRNTNSSHCLTVTGLDDVGTSPLAFIELFQEDPSTATWSGTEIETNDGEVTYKDFIENLLDDSVPLQSHYEETCEGRFQVCATECATFDAVMCDEEVQ